jgi:DNA ligase-1
MRFSYLSFFLEKLENTSSRNQMTEVLGSLFNETDPSEIDKVTYLLLGSIAPGFSGVVFNIAEKMIVEVIAQAYSKKKDEVTREYKEKGDLGETAFEFAKISKTKLKKELSVSEVFDKLTEIAKDNGEGSQERKIEKTAELLKNLDPLSAKYVARILVGKLRLGFSDKTILDALSYLETGDKSAKKDLEGAYNVLPDVGYIASEVKKKGVKKTVAEISPKVGYPLLSMLAARLKSPVEMIKKMGKVYVEPKFDGLRIQLHYKSSGFENGKKYRAFTRNLNETSWMFPELKDIDKYVNAKEAILDSEAVGVDEGRKKMANFQTTMTRRRKHDIENIASKVSIVFNVFDIMLKDGKGYVNVPYEERRKILAATVKSGKLLAVVDYEITQNPERISELMQKELREGLEGIIVKKSDAGYIAGRTGYRWVKMKEKESQKAKLADTLDCVVMGYYKGRGKRTVFGLGGFLVGVPDKGVIKTFTKIGTGLTDEQFKELKKRLNKLESEEKPGEYGEVDKTLKPDVWVQPSLVTEIAADEITRSPMHSSGFALRFPRLVKFRDDKSWEEATSIAEVKKLFKLQ